MICRPSGPSPTFSYNSDFPANIHVLRPRKVSVSAKLDKFLDEHCLATVDDLPKPKKSRPIAGNINAIDCAECGEVEYLTRDYCRCGHYIRGQLEDEYIEWEQRLHFENTELSKAIARKMRPLRYLVAVSMLFLIGPLLYLTFWPDSFTLKTLFWMIPSLVAGGGAAFIEKRLDQALQKSAYFLNTYTFDAFIEQRFFIQVNEASWTQSETRMNATK
jgi:hypothetical protein